MTESRSIELYVETLVLYGFPPEDRYLIANAVEQELTRLLAEQCAPNAFKQNGHIDKMNSSHFTISSGERAKNIGIQVAQAVYREVSQ